MSSLHGTVSFEQVHDVTVVISKQLHFDVLRLVQESFNETSTVAEGGNGFGSGSFKSIANVIAFSDNSHTTTTTTKGGLDDDWETVLSNESLSFFNSVNWTRGTRNRWNTSGISQVSSRDLITDRVNNLSGRADPCDTGSFNLSSHF
ncbi:hypothetical protein WICPIJ_003990 [Wickerhamomyces pijperi]|uniref:Uncharacterized protein n=1 Tax=Wickerhamomyces pijperi TaxID=599730 RepID=A0A9P8TMI0_WICPI|nr:hypothetical protein WICPIJ_003990 [Wickerhamomyces pijperi]